MTTRIVRVFGPVLLALPLLAGCFTYRSTAIDNLAPRERVHVIANTEFVMHAQLFNGSSPMQERCRVTGAEGTLDRVAADTLFLSPLTVLRPAEGESAACQNLVRGFIVRDAGSELQVHALRFSRQRAKRTLLWGALLGAILYWYITVLLEPVEVYNFIQ